MAYRIIITDFNVKRKCHICNVELSNSIWDTKPVAIRLSKNPSLKNTTHCRYSCISCALKGHQSCKVTIEQLQKFFHLDNLKEESRYV